METIRCFVVDDEPPARQELKFLLESIPGVQVVGEAGSGEEALELLLPLDPDVVILDIQLHDMDGLQVASRLADTPAPPLVIFATAYDAYAVRAFELNAVDYLLKPIDAHRLREAILRAKARARDGGKELAAKMDQVLKELRAREGGGGKVPAKIVAEEGGKLVLVDPAEVVYATVEGRNVRLHLPNRSLEVKMPLHELEDRLEGKGFVRTHRAFLVNGDRIKEIHPWFKGALKLVMDDPGGSEVPVSRNYVKEFRDRLGL